jgi:hypothetical protein
MAKYLKLFETTSEYEAYIQTDYDKPNVSHCEDQGGVYYNPFVPPLPNNIITYEASEKLTETTSSKSSGSLNTTKFNTSIVSHTFEEGVGTIEFEEDVTAIYHCAFASTNITEIQLPSTLVSIGMDTYQGVGAFSSCKSLTSVTIPDNVTSIGELAFGSCSALTNITIPNSVTSIGNQAFYYCSGLTSVAIGNSVTSIGNSAFLHCDGLTSVTIGNGVTSIGQRAFANCTSLTSVNMPSGVTSIGQSAFYYCTSLTSITIEATTPPTLGSSAFDANPSSKKIYAPAASVETYKAASGWSTYAADIEAIPTT